MRKILLWALVLVWSCMGCNSDPIGKSTGPLQVRVPDVSDDLNGLHVEYFDPANPYAQRVVERTLGRDDVQERLEQVTGRGFSFVPEQSFVTEGTTEDDRVIEITALAMASPGGDSEAIHLFCIRGGDQYTIVTTRLRREDAGGHAVTSNGGGFSFEVIDVNGEGFNSPAAGLLWSWGEWARCISRFTISGLVACAASCYGASIAYLPCLAICGAGVFLGGLVNCTLIQLGW